MWSIATAIVVTTACIAPEALHVVSIPGGTFMMGSEGPQARPDESPTHRVHVDAFHIQRTEVTNAMFKAFVDATGWVTTAQRPVDWEILKHQVPPGTPKPDDELLHPGSMVFVQPQSGTSPHDVAARWVWVTGANWQNPEGPGSNLDERWNHPVVHVSHEDAQAYATWLGGSLPTEAQWERAARGPVQGATHVWGEAAIDPSHANVWQGVFPSRNTAQDGFTGTAPVGRFEPNGYGLFDMAGNVWEWTADRYDHDLYAGRSGKDVRNPAGPPMSDDPRHPPAADVRTHRGGSFLCHPSYCSSYRPSARMATTADSAMSHLGFRVVFTEAQLATARARHQADGDPAKSE